MDGKVSKVSTGNNGLTIEGVKKEKLKGEKYDVFIHTTNVVITALNTDDKWRINKLEGKNARMERHDSKKVADQKESISKPKKEISVKEKESVIKEKK